MNPIEIKKRAASLLYTTKPNPYFVTAVYVIFFQAISTLGLNFGGQPFMVDLEAVTVGNYENAIMFVPENMTTPTTIFLIAAELVFIALDFGYYSYCLHAGREQPAGFFDLMDGFLVFFRAVALRLVRGILVYLGFALFLVPGVFLAYLYSMSPRLLLDHPDWSPFHCMRESRHLMQSRLKEYFFLRLSLIGWNIIALFPLASIIAKPYSTLCETEFYLRITVTAPREIDETSRDSDEKPPWEY